MCYILCVKIEKKLIGKEVVFVKSVKGKGISSGDIAIIQGIDKDDGWIYLEFKKNMVIGLEDENSLVSFSPESFTESFLRVDDENIIGCIVDTL